MVLTVNGSFPGPTIYGNWGDTFVIHVYNGLTNNGTGLHFHGIRQNYTNQMDGVPSITQCPTAPGEVGLKSIALTFFTDKPSQSPIPGERHSTERVGIILISNSKPGRVFLVESSSMVLLLQTMTSTLATFF